MQRVEVIWDDAHAKLEDISLEEAAKVEPVRTHSMGWLVSENDAGLVIAVDRWPAHPDLAGSWHFLPRGMIVAVIRLGPVEPSPHEEDVLGIG